MAQGGMSYENAPATTLVATACALCGRPLVDAPSVERGIGPDCARKYGFGDAQAAPDFSLAHQAMAGVASLDSLADEAFEATAGGDAEAAHALANRLVHRIAVGLPLEGLRAATRALEGLGFVRLAHRLAERAGAVRIEREGEAFHVRAPYDPAHVERMRRVPGRRFVREARGGYDLVPVASRGALWAALRASFAGQMGIGPDGVFVIPAA